MEWKPVIIEEMVYDTIQGTWHDYRNKIFKTADDKLYVIQSDKTMKPIRLADIPKKRHDSDDDIDDFLKNLSPLLKNKRQKNDKK